MATKRVCKNVELKSRFIETKILEREVCKDPIQVTLTFRALLEDLDKGLPRATSGDVLNSRVKW